MSRYEEKILRIINESSSHLTIDEIYSELLKVEPNVVLATVYNNVNKLVNDGKVAKLSIEGQIDHYDKATKHDHLICSKCGAIIDYKFSDLTAKLEQELGEAIDGYDLRIHYLCPRCKNYKTDK